MSLTENKTSSHHPSRKLTLLDAVCVIVGTIIGSGIFGVAATVAGMSTSPAWLLALWAIGGLLSLIGSLCFAELTTTYDQPGGDYAYLRTAFGDKTGLAFAWAAFWIIRPGNIGLMAMIFAQYSAELIGHSNSLFAKMLLATGAIIVLSVTNLLGVQSGKRTQNILTILKVLGIGMVVAAVGFLPEYQSLTVVARNPPTFSNLFVALVLVMFTYGGWNDISFVATEVKNPGRNLLRCLVIGVFVVTLCYVLFNVALLLGIGFDKIIDGNRLPATRLMMLVSGTPGQIFIAMLVSISCLGAINGMIFTSPRIYFAVGQRYPGLAWLATWSEAENRISLRNGPWIGMICQAIITIILVAICGRQENGFEQLLAATAPVFWIFLGLTFLALIVLRSKRPNHVQQTTDPNKPFRVPLYPFSPILMIVVSVAITISSVNYVIAEGFWLAAALIAVLMSVGIVFAFLIRPEPSETK